MAKLYSNENFPLPVVEKLRVLGHDVLTLQETGKGKQAMPDDEVLEFARSEGRVLLTFNRKHFIRLHMQNPEHPGIVVCTFDKNFEDLARRIDSELASLSKHSGQLIRVNRPQTD